MAIVDCFPIFSPSDFSGYATIFVYRTRLPNFSSCAYVGEACGLDHGQSELLILSRDHCRSWKELCLQDEEIKTFLGCGAAGL